RFVGGISQSVNHSCPPNGFVERNAGEEITIEYGKEFVRPGVRTILYTIVSGTD
ncbi:hypothetical protein JG687_00013827, partial [Phytophthora cactorum]